MTGSSVARIAHDLSTAALDWLHANRERGAFPADTGADLGDPDSAYKPLGETALAASLVLREGAAGSAQLRTARELVDFTWQQMREGALLYERQLRYPLLTDPLETYAHFARSGHRHDELEELLTHCAAVGSMVEVVPNRRLAVANAHRTVGVGADDWPSLTRATWLGQTPPPWAIDWMTGYSVTHTVFHLTDWGARPDGLPADMTAYVTDWLPVWIDIWSEVGQWDLVGELLIVGVCLPRPRLDAAEWARLAALQHADGMVPRDGEPVTGSPDQRFLNHQHTTVVATVAGTLALSRLLNGAA
ncbi:DUF6895 family protein [Saccharothrix coeruleofusca]|uniref:DUF6895 domain-containing protein n=1 Tax=Saccharothrix coeruleofusca TaxID=33919 RepID=A0A918ANF1_9PSEU|nr:hypothetical protein [Saccharothrix coeruleofusca]GGP64784.1 hypothetical protein GCM10010185_41700 [Saccharothrix coeruleofusca]